MRKSVLTAVRVLAVVGVIAVSGITTAMAKNTGDFLYNITEQTDEVVVKEICKKVGETYQLYSRNEYRYDEYGELASMEVAYWNQEAGVWQNDHRITYSRDEVINTQEIAYMKWNRLNNTYDTPSEVAVYQPATNELLHSYVIHKSEE